MLEQVDLHRYIAQILRSERYSDPRRLPPHGYKVYSQADEDGIIAEIFRRIGTGSRTFIEFGIERGLECNSLWLLVQKWTGLWIEGNEAFVSEARGHHAESIAEGRLKLVHAHVNVDNAPGLVEKRLDDEVDLLSIDLDFNDYWIWKALDLKPRVVVIEYNATWRPPTSITVPYDAEAQWDGSNYFGASLAALTKLGASKGYSLVGCSLSGVNAFFVRNDLLGDHFIGPGDSALHYEPARFFMTFLLSGHPPRIGRFVQV